MRLRHLTIGAAALCAVVALALPFAPQAAQSTRPNILLAIADDWSYPHAAGLGDAAVRTPTVDRLAREGTSYALAFVATPSCSASRAALLTGQYPHRLAEGSQLWSFLPGRFRVYTEMLAGAGYHVGSSRKGWGPGQLEPAGRTVDPAGAKYADFDAFLAGRPANAPFAYWFGSQDPHRPYTPGSGAEAGVDPTRITVPAYLPDTPLVRADIADYLFEVQRFDREVGAILARLATDGELDNTLVVVTSDNGMPFPRAKANLYDGGVRVPLVFRWPGQVPAGVVSDAMVTNIDLAPTFLAAAGLAVPADVSGRALQPLWQSQPVSSGRDHIFVERERHANVRKGDLGYPARAVRTRDHLYIRNLRPDRWPAGDPETHVAVGPFGDIDGGPTKTLLLDQRASAAIRPFFELATAKRPAEELYVLATDPDQLRNVAADPAHAATLARLRNLVTTWMRSTGDPRATSDSDVWDTYPYYGGPAAVEAR